MEHLIRLAAPEVRYDVRAEADLVRIIETDELVTMRPPERRRRRVLRSLVAAVLLVAATIGVTGTLPRTAEALTPPLLTSDSVAGTASELLSDLARRRRLQHDSHARSIVANTWALNVEVGENEQILISNVEPHRYEVMMAPDDGMDIRITAAEPFPGQEQEGLVPPGTLISEEHVPADATFAAQLPEPFPTNGAEVEEWLALFTGVPRLSAGQTFTELQALLMYYPMTREQEAAILEHLAGLESIETMGTVTDRLGRPGIAFIARDKNPGEYEDILIVAPESGTILATETIYIGNSRTDLTAPTVINYSAWKRN